MVWAIALGSVLGMSLTRTTTPTVVNEDVKVRKHPNLPYVVDPHEKIVNPSHGITGLQNVLERRDRDILNKAVRDAHNSKPYK